MKRTFFFLSFILLAMLQTTAYKKQDININVDGMQRNMVTFTPNSLPAKSPLFIVTHGMNQNPEYQYDSDKMYEMIDTAKFVVTYLRSDGTTWDIGGTKDQNFVVKTIEEMVNRFDIDPDRVYWSGFSMGSMLIHHCIANMQDKIAAFAPTSGIQFSEQPWNNCRKPVNLLEVIAYDDNVFGYEEYGIHNYIENYAKHDNHPIYSKTTNYKPIASSWFDGDLEKWTGGPNGGEVWLYSYHNGGHWPMDLNRHLIWNFCKRFSLNNPTVRLTVPAGETTNVCIAPTGEAVFPDINIRATAKPGKGKVAKVDFYDGPSLLESQRTSPYQTTITTPKSGKHNLRAVVTDTNDKTAEATCLVNCVATRTSYSMHQTFTTENTIPQAWYVCNGTTRFAGGPKTYTTGCRLLHFTNTTRAFNYGLLVQNIAGKAKGAWAIFGDSHGRSSLHLHAGRYVVKYKVCNWNMPEFSPVTLAIEDEGGQELTSETFTPTVNVGGDATAKFSRIDLSTFEFDIPEAGNYRVAFYADAAKNADFVIGQVSIQALSFVETGIQGPSADGPTTVSSAFDLQGRRIDNHDQNIPSQRGIYVVNGRKVIR